jgi:hypothetical protein
VLAQVRAPVADRLQRDPFQLSIVLLDLRGDAVCAVA